MKEGTREAGELSQIKGIVSILRSVAQSQQAHLYILQGQADKKHILGIAMYPPDQCNLHGLVDELFQSPKQAESVLADAMYPPAQYNLHGFVDEVFQRVPSRQSQSAAARNRERAFDPEPGTWCAD
ncbi:hypothetical protein C8A03DRAFT_38712 [Achaetomium macrosporum]|uniref:Uncharacterized protein n=1 Tax=Achaetomium macrosporum TaxID=79813 RepID=A0AAN7C1V3_9PEZI|nr:hypothetical protein C8A03DRAFT_38712 [Achaetomium macrosporum]